MPPFPKTLLLATALPLLSGGPIAAQQGDAEAQAAPLEAATVEAQVEELKADTGLESSIKDGLLAQYDDALKTLAAADASRKQAAAYREALASGADDAEALRRQLEELSQQPAPSPPADDTGLEDLRKLVESKRASLSQLKEQLADAEGELTRIKGRPVEVSARLPAARREQSDAATALAQPAENLTPGRRAERTQLEARAAALEAEVEMLGQEQLSQSARESLAQARQELLAEQVSRAEAELAGLEEALRQARMGTAEKIAAEVDALAERASPADAPRIEELRSFSADLQDLTGRLESASREHDELSRQRGRLDREYRRIQEEIKLGALEGGSAPIVSELRRRLANPQPIRWSIDRRAKELRKLRLAAFQVEQELREQDEEEADGILELRGRILRELEQIHAALVRELAQLDSEQRGYHNLILEVREYLNRKLFWQPSSPAIGRDFFNDLPAAALWTFGGERWREGARAVAARTTRRPVTAFLIGAVILTLLLVRRRLIRSLEHSGKRIRRISTDRYVHTLRALLDSVLLAAPIPLLLAALAWGLDEDPSGSTWVRGLSFGLVWSALFLAGVQTLREIARPEGLGVAHFGWKPGAAATLRRGLLWLAILYVPAELLASTTFFEESSRYFDSLGRLTFMLALLWVAVVFAWLFSPRTGMLADHLEAHPKQLLSRTRGLWYPAAVGVPLVLVIMAGLGYVFTAFSLSFLVHGTLRIISLGVIVYGLAIRWFMMRERRIALEEALAARRARRDAAEKTAEDASEEIVAVEQAEEELDLASIGRQTRRLLKSLSVVGVTVAIWLLWSTRLPIDETNALVSHGGLTLLACLRLVLITAVAATIVRNLPGLLDLAGLRKTGLDPGTRYAVAAICQYLVIALAALMAFQALDLDWAQFGWIAAALSVGLGFGLQEIVANFVCGIILLFERPIRVGDVVTVENVTGTVSRIRMRATTITNWDRQDFVVPNKSIVTGSLINWTLTNSVNRITIPVGVAYGSDTARSLSLLDEIARDHPLILDDPAPLISFEGFGDSTLDLVLRCYLPTMDNRLKTITELHSEIDRRFAEAGIEIAFPQRDLHLRSVDPAAARILGGSG